MSASEMLKHPDFDHRDDFDVVSWAALVAVVEAAERWVTSDDLEDGSLESQYDAIVSALAALEEALS